MWSKSNLWNFQNFLKEFIEETVGYRYHEGGDGKVGPLAGEGQEK